MKNLVLCFRLLLILVVVVGCAGPYYYNHPVTDPTVADTTDHPRYFCWGIWVTVVNSTGYYAEVSYSSRVIFSLIPADDRSDCFPRGSILKVALYDKRGGKPMGTATYRVWTPDYDYYPYNSRASDDAVWNIKEYIPIPAR